MRPMILRKCKCGDERLVSKWKIDHGMNLKCRSCASRDANLVHGYKGTRIYEIWCNMKKRCNNANYKEYHYYGGRGIKVCKRWNKFMNFLEDMGPTYKDIFTLDRIDPNGNYEIGNCRWATMATQNANKRVPNGKTLKEYGLV